MKYTILTLCLLALPAPCQPESAAAPVEAVFYRAFFVDRGLENKPDALTLYLRFLEQAPTHELAGQAVRNAMAILEKTERKDEAAALAKTHEKILSETVPAGINASFLDPKADVADFISRFESESREIFKHRHDIAKLVGLQDGQAIADVGAGTGVFTNLFARAVGDKGKVYAVELSPVMIQRLAKLRRTMNLPWVDVVRCSESSTMLTEGSVDVVFICDTYHHFTHPASTLASIHKALRPGGQLILIDFHRIVGKSRKWLLEHVRAGEDVFSAEVEKAGFERVRREETPFLDENYMVRFRRS